MNRIKASVIIPTFNRDDSLERTLKSLALVNYRRSDWEIIVVDSNSTDNTKSIVNSFGKDLNIKYVLEERLSFTVARESGAKAAGGEILIYIDDDVTVTKDWLQTVIETYNYDKAIGMVGGPVKPIYERTPANWVLQMPGFWLSLFDCGNVKKEVEGIPGPNLTVRKNILDEVGGFPPDTIYMKKEGTPWKSNKIYIGPGDWGLCQKVKNAGYKIMYSPKAVVYHHIPPTRLTKNYWHSRFRGEGCYIAISRQHDMSESSAKLLLNSIISLFQAFKRIIYILGATLRKHPTELYIFEISYYLSYAKVEWILAFHKDLADKLWKIGLKGVVPDDYKKLIGLLPS